MRARSWVAAVVGSAVLASAWVVPAGGASGARPPGDAVGDFVKRHHPATLPSAGDTVGAAAAFRSAGMRAAATEPCYQRNHSDPAGDVTDLDGVEYATAYSCTDKEWFVGTLTDDVWLPSDLGEFVMWVDLDRRGATGCAGVDVAVVAVYYDAFADLIAGAVRTPSCDDSTWTLDPADVWPVHDGDVIGMFIPQSVFNRAAFDWNLTLAAYADPPIPGDRMPDAGVHTATNFLPPFQTGFAATFNGSYDAVVPGRFNNDGRSDLLLYGRGTKPDYLLFSRSGTPGFVAGTSIAINGNYTALIPGDFDGNGKTDILFYGSGTARDSLLLRGTAGTVWVAGPALAINGVFDQILPGDFDGNGRTDLLFYRSGSDADALWLARSGSVGFNAGWATDIDLAYTYLRSGDVSGDNRDDVIAYSSSAADALLRSTGSSWSESALDLPSGFFDTAVADFNGNGRDDAFFYGLGTSPDLLLRGTGSAPFLAEGPAVTVNATFTDVVPLDVNGDGRGDLLFYAAGTAPDAIWLGKA